jgi:hypothetical protein
MRSCRMGPVCPFRVRVIRRRETDGRASEPEHTRSITCECPWIPKFANGSGRRMARTSESGHLLSHFQVALLNVASSSALPKGDRINGSWSRLDVHSDGADHRPQRRRCCCCRQKVAARGEVCGQSFGARDAFWCRDGIENSSIGESEFWEGKAPTMPTQSIILLAQWLTFGAD